MSKNIWYVSKYANILKYGANTRQAYFCKYISRKNYNVRLVLSNSSHLFDDLPKFNGRYKDMVYDGYQVTWVNSKIRGTSSSVKRIISWLSFELGVIGMAWRSKYEKPDVVIASSLSILSVLSGAFYKKFFGTQFLFEVRDIWPKSIVDIKGISNKSIFIAVLRWVEHLGYRYSDNIIGTMPGLSKHVQSEVGLGSKVITIPQGFDLDFYNDKQEKLPDTYINEYIPKDKFIVTYAGTIGEANGLEYIVEAARHISEMGDSFIHFLFVGDGYLKGALKEQAKDLKNVSFAPSVKKTEVNHVLTESHLLVASVLNKPIYEYGISLNKFIDYMYAKKPIVCMHSGYHSIINEANCGEFTPSEDSASFADAIKKYSQMPQAMRDRLGMNGYNHLVNNLSYDILVNKYIEIFR